MSPEASPVLIAGRPLVATYTGKKDTPSRVMGQPIATLSSCTVIVTSNIY